MRLRVFLLAVLAWPTLILAGCGDEPAPSRVPADPDEALAWVREAVAQEDGAELRARLAEWPADAPAFRDHETTRIVLTWTLRDALSEGDTTGALETYRLLKERFDGEGRTPEGSALSASALAGGVFEVLLDAARARIEGPDANQDAANELLARANALLEDVSESDRPLLEAAQRWILLRRIKDANLGVASSGPPQIIMLTDDFALGEAVLPGVLKRWARDGKAYELEVVLIPLWRDFVRVGTRRVPSTLQEEAAAMKKRAKEMGARMLPTTKSSATHERELGMVPGTNALLIVDRKGIIVARMTGYTIDPRGLEGVVQRVLSR